MARTGEKMKHAKKMRRKAKGEYVSGAKVFGGALKKAGEGAQKANPFSVGLGLADWVVGNDKKSERKK
jgi:hypothetical protein